MSQSWKAQSRFQELHGVVSKYGNLQTKGAPFNFPSNHPPRSYPPKRGPIADVSQHAMRLLQLAVLLQVSLACIEEGNHHFWAPNRPKVMPSDAAGNSINGWCGITTWASVQTQKCQVQAIVSACGADCTGACPDAW